MDTRGEYIDSHAVFAALGDDDIGVTFGRFDELEVHGFDVGFVVFKHLFVGSTAFHEVAAHDTHKAVVGIGINKDLNV